MLTRPIRVSVTGPFADLLPEVLGWGPPGNGDWMEVVPAGGAPDVVVTLVGPGDEATALAAAHDLAPSSPVLALIPARDEAEGRRVMDCGASGWIGLNEPLPMLRAMIAAAASRQLWPDRGRS